MSDALPPVVADPELLRALAADLQAAEFTVDGLERLWGPEAAAALFRGNRVAVVQAAAARRAARQAAAGAGGAAAAAASADASADARYALAALFVLGLPTAQPVLAAALPTIGVTGLVRLGLARLQDGASPEPDVVALVDLRPYDFVDDRGPGRWWIVSDLGENAVDGALPEGHVLGIGGASTTLSGLQLPVPVRSVLDIGTGCGIQAMHASRFAERVVATDVSQRALDMAAFNALLNDVDGIEFRLGSLFEPVAGERFDRIVSNPPFVITPRRDGVPEYEYRDGGMVGDALVRTVLQGLEAHLAPGGTAQLLGNWEYRADADGLDRVASWIADGDLDAWVVERDELDPARYAETWIRDGGTRPGSAEFDRLVGLWLDDFADRGVVAVGFGYVFARAAEPARAPESGSGGAPRVRRFERLPESLGAHPAGLGATVARAFDAWDWLAAHDDDALWAAHLRVAGDVTEERHYWPGNDDPTVMTLVQGGGFGRRIDSDTALTALVGACDGDLSVGQIVLAIAELLRVDAEALRADLLPAVRELVRDGLLLTS